MTTPAGTFNYSYDAAGRPSSMTNPFSETTIWAYLNNNWLQSQTLANGASANYTYNALGHVTRLLNQLGGNTLSDFSSIGYKGAGNRNSVTASIPGATSLNGTTGYSYDSKDQLTQETSTRNGGFNDDFGYDSAGNPTSFKGVTKSYNANNQQTGTGFAYDGNGNPTTYNSTTLTFDPENRMTAYGSLLTAGYTGHGLRAWKQNASGRTYFLYDGLFPILELDSNAVITGTSTFGEAGIVSRRVGTNSVSYSLDSAGDVAERSDAGGNVLSNYLLDVHGSVFSGTLNDQFGYRAQWGNYTDNETGLQLLTHRYYDQNAGRFLTRDPIGYSGGVNLYSYVTNNPANLIDPEGTQVRSDRNFRPGDIPNRPPRQPSGSPRPFNEGGILSAATLSEFISANQRARQPCKRFGERFWQGFSETNRFLPGALAPTGTGVLTSKKLAEISGGPTPFRWAGNGFRPGGAFGGVISRLGFNFVLVGGTYESGVAVGSFIDAAGCPCGY